MHFVKNSDEMIALFQAVAPTGPGIEQRKMFGSLCWFVNDNLGGGLHGEHDFLLRLSEPHRAELMQLGAEQFDPMGGRPMKEYLVLPESILADRTALADWIDRSVKFVASLPEKSKKR